MDAEELGSVKTYTTDSEDSEDYDRVPNMDPRDSEIDRLIDADLLAPPEGVEILIDPAEKVKNEIMDGGAFRFSTRADYVEPPPDAQLIYSDDESKEEPKEEEKSKPLDYN